MANVLGPLSVCLGGLGFILSTVPSAARTLNTHRDRSHHLRETEMRLASCYSKFSSLEDRWYEPKALQLFAGPIDILSSAKSLELEIGKEIQRHCTNEERNAWQRITRVLSERRFVAPHSVAVRHSPATWYVLWHEDTLSRWTTRLEQMIAAVEDIVEESFHQRTAAHFNTIEAQDDDVRHFETFTTRLSKLGTRLHQRCALDSRTYGWEVGLKPPRSGCDISQWSCPIPVTIELQFTAKQAIHREEHVHFRLQIKYEEEDSISDALEEATAQVNQAIDAGLSADSASYQLTRCFEQAKSTRTTLSLGHLLDQNPHVFDDDAWYNVRASLIFGLSEWSLLLWNTPWLERLCCHGLTIDLDSQAAYYTLQTFESDQHHQCWPVEQKHRLRNLGLVYAQLILGLPIRVVKGEDASLYELWSAGDWEDVRRAGINKRVVQATGSLPLRDAIDFCLDPNAPMIEHEFKPGHLLRYIEKMHKPIKKWYTSESSIRARFSTLMAKSSRQHQVSHSPTEVIDAESRGAKGPHLTRTDRMNTGKRPEVPGIGTKEFQRFNIHESYTPNKPYTSSEDRFTKASPPSQYFYRDTQTTPRYSGPTTPAYSTASSPAQGSIMWQSYMNPGIGSSTQAIANKHEDLNIKKLPVDIQAQVKSLERRHIRTDPNTNNEEALDTRYRRVAETSRAHFFVTGRVFKMLWNEPAGQVNPGKTRNSTHFSTVWLGGQAFSEIRHFIVVRNKGFFSQCIPIQTYRGQGAAKAGLIMQDHGIIHTSATPPDQLVGEALTKYSIRVHASKDEMLHPASRVNYGKAYAVEHDVKVREIGMVEAQHRYLLSTYFDAAMRGE